MSINRIRALARALPFLLLTGAAYAQTASPPPAPPPAAQASDAPAVAPVPKERLDQMLAPIALYPDELVTNILMASTYPSQVVEATNWLKDPQNAALKGDALADAIRPQTWDPSVKFLIPFPQVIQQLNDRPDWMQELGNAFTVQQSDTMNEVQHLRGLALSCGKLQSTAQMRVTHRGSYIAIAPADPQMVYVPVYNPTIVYGVWPYPAYAPRYYPWPSAYILGGAGFGVDVGIGYSVGFGAVGGYWGWNRPDWQRGGFNVNYAQVSRFGNYDRSAMSARYGGARWHNGMAQNRAAFSAQSSATSRRHGHSAAVSGSGRGEWHSGGGKHNVGHSDNGWHGNHVNSHGGGNGNEHGGGHGNGNGHGGGNGDDHGGGHGNGKGNGKGGH
jgi:hypothetical protein